MIKACLLLVRLFSSLKGYVVKNFILILSFVLFSPASFADTLSSKMKAEELADNVMNAIGSGDMEGGVMMTKPYISVPEYEFLALLDQMKGQQPAISKRFGKTLSVEVASIEEVGESLMLILYLQKFERHVLRWKFYFYKPDSEWRLNTFTFDDQIHKMFKIQ